MACNDQPSARALSTCCPHAAPPPAAATTPPPPTPSPDPGYRRGVQLLQALHACQPRLTSASVSTVADSLQRDRRRNRRRRSPYHRHRARDHRRRRHHVLLHHQDRDLAHRTRRRPLAVVRQDRRQRPAPATSSSAQPAEAAAPRVTMQSSRTSRPTSTRTVQMDARRGQDCQRARCATVWCALRACPGRREGLSPPHRVSVVGWCHLLCASNADREGAGEEMA
jgi:hypothetical protein